MAVEILSEDFERAVITAGLRARSDALACGHPVIFVDDLGRYIEELPDGRRLQIRLQVDKPRDAHVLVVRELTTVG